MDQIVNIPYRLNARPKSARGFPIPYTALINNDGTPNFRTIDTRKVDDAVRRRLCALCAQPLGRHIFFIGGPLSMGHGHFTDPGMHVDCAEFALRTCPYLAKDITYSDKPHKKNEGVALHIHEEVAKTKPERHGLARTSSYSYDIGAGHIIAQLPWTAPIRWFVRGIEEGVTS